MKKYLIAEGIPFYTQRWVKAVYNRMNWKLKDGWEIQPAPYYAWDGQRIRWLDRETYTKLEAKEYPMRPMIRAIADPLWLYDDTINIGDKVLADCVGPAVLGTLIGITLSDSEPYLVECGSGCDFATAGIRRARPRVALSWEELEEKLGCELTLK